MRIPTRCAGALALIAVLTGTRAPAQPRPILPAPPAEILASPTRIVLQLPERGGVAINAQPLEWKELAAQLRAIYSKRPVKVLLVDAAPARTRAELERVVTLARREGIQVYAATPEGIR